VLDSERQTFLPYPQNPDWLGDPHILLSYGYQRFFPQSLQTEHKADHLPPFNARSMREATSLLPSIWHSTYYTQKLCLYLICNKSKYQIFKTKSEVFIG
jgi:hypothetical protein